MPIKNISFQFTEFNLTRKHISEMFFKAESEKELREPTHPERMSWIVKADDDDIDQFMELIIDDQSKIICNHQPAPDCAARGTITIMLKRVYNVMYRLWKVLVD